MLRGVRFLSCNGYNKNGQATTPADWFENITLVGNGSKHTCAVNTEGQVKCWGSGRDGVLDVPEVRDALVVRDGAGQVVREAELVRREGVRGSNARQDLERGLLQVVRAGKKKVVGLAVGNRHNCVVDVGLDVYCWGWNL